MVMGAGKYDAECTGLLRKVGADMVVVIVGGGARGSGFSLSARPEMMASGLPVVVAALREAADQIERDAARTSGFN